MTPGPIRLLYANGAAIPGESANSVNIAKMCAAFTANGVETLLTVAGRPDRAVWSTIAERYGLTDRFRVQTIGLPGWSMQLGIAACLARAVWFSPDIVYARDVRLAYSMMVAGFRTVIELHTDYFSLGERSRAYFDRMVGHERLAGVVVISEAIAGALRRSHPRLAVDKVIVAHDGADAGPEPAIRPREPGKPLTVGYVGHLYPGKGMEIIVPLAERCPWANFEVVGGRAEDLAFWKARTEGLANLHLRGPVPHAEVRARLANFDVVLAPYLKQVSVWKGKQDVAQWMSPLKMFEYMAAAKAIVCSDLPVIREVLTNEETALLCDPDDLDAWATALRRIEASAGLGPRLGGNARDLLVSRYTWRERAREILDRLLTRPASPKDRD